MKIDQSDDNCYSLLLLQSETQNAIPTRGKAITTSVVLWKSLVGQERVIVTSTTNAMVILFVATTIVDGTELGLVDLQIVVNLHRKLQDQVPYGNQGNNFSLKVHEKWLQITPTRLNIPTKIIQKPTGMMMLNGVRT